MTPRGLFVTGTDTGVGKTIVSAALVCFYRRRSPVCYWKPIQTGIEQDDDTATVARLAACAPEEIVGAGVRLESPVSPHLAAQRAGQRISVDALMAMKGPPQGGHYAHVGGGPTDVGAAFRRPETFWIIEGAGGTLVPLNDEELLVDLMTHLALPVVVVARTMVGTINHTLLTIEALRHRGLVVAAVVMSGAPDAAAREAITRHGGVAVVELPVLDLPGPASIEAWVEQVRGSWPI